MIINKYVPRVVNTGPAVPIFRRRQTKVMAFDLPELAYLVHRFGMRSDIRSFNLGGMGCSAGLISIDLAKHLLASRPGSLAMVVSTENITPNLYLGNQRSMQLQNTLFR